MPQQVYHVFHSVVHISQVSLFSECQEFRVQDQDTFNASVWPDTKEVNVASIRFNCDLRGAIQVLYT